MALLLAFCIIFVNVFRFLSSLCISDNLAQYVPCKGRLFSQTLTDRPHHEESLLVGSMCVFNQGTGNYNLGNGLTKSTRTSHTSQCKNVANVILEHFI